MIIFYKEIHNLYIKNCDKGNQTVFQRFAKSFVKNVHKYDCINVCVPIYLGPILRTIEHDLEYCKNSKDYYCMYEVALQEIVPLAPETLKSCVMKSPKIFDIKNPNHNRVNLEDPNRQIIKDIENETIEERKPAEHTFHLIVEMSGNIIINQEYLIYDTLSLFGTVGGTLSLFLGFSFYSFIIMLIDFFAARCKRYKPASVNTIDNINLRANNHEENLNSTESRNHVNSVGEDPQRRLSMPELPETGGQILVDISTPYQPGGWIMPTTLLLDPPPGFSDRPTAQNIDPI